MAKVEITHPLTPEKEVLTSKSINPPFQQQLVEPYRRYFTDDGLTDGSHDLTVDGSVTPVDFWVPADPTEDRYITAINFILGYGATGKPYQWGDNAALTNGVRLFYTSFRGEVDVHDGITSIQDLWRLTDMPIATAWEIRHIGVNNDYGLFVSVNLLQMVPPYGVKLDAGTSQKLALRVRDAMPTTASDTFNAIACGFDRFNY
jgi:hypothetical protein